MPRTSTVNERDVAAVVAALQTQGAPVTLRAVRDTLGRGSMSTVAEHLRAVRAQARAMRAGDDAAREPFPHPVAEALDAGARAVWRELLDALDGRAQELEARAAVRIEAAEEQARAERAARGEAHRENEGLLEALALERERVAGVADALERSEREGRRGAVALAAERAKTEGLERYAAEVGRQIEDWTARHAAAAEAATRLGALRERDGALHEERLAIQAKDAAAKIAGLEGAIAAARKEREAAIVAGAALENRLSSAHEAAVGLMKGRIETLETERAVAESHAATMTARCASSEKALAETKTKLVDATVRAERAVERNEQFQARMSGEVAAREVVERRIGQLTKSFEAFAGKTGAR